MEIERESIIGLFEWLTVYFLFFFDKFIFPLDEVCRQACLAWHSTVGMFEKENIKNHTLQCDMGSHLHIM
jgi:hypothetical protein